MELEEILERARHTYKAGAKPARGGYGVLLNNQEIYTVTGSGCCLVGAAAAGLCSRNYDGLYRTLGLSLDKHDALVAGFDGRMYVPYMNKEYYDAAKAFAEEVFKENK